MRLTIDVDTKTEPNIRRIIRLLKSFKHCENEVYETTRGFHIIIYDTGLSFSQVLSIRQMYGDDKARIKLDEELFFKPKQVLFTSKNGIQRKLVSLDKDDKWWID